MIVSEGERNRERDSINAGLNVDFRGSNTGAIYGMRTSLGTISFSDLKD